MTGEERVLDIRITVLEDALRTGDLGEARWEVQRVRSTFDRMRGSRGRATDDERKRALNGIRSSDAQRSVD